MIDGGFDQPRREQILREWAEARSEYEAAMNWTEDLAAWSDKEVKALQDAAACRSRMAQAERDYFGEIPLVPMSLCPFCAEELLQPFDSFGLDGLWWRPEAGPEPVPSCPHFCVVRGAVSFGSKRPVAPYFEVHPGPEVPYVLPSLLEQPGMVCVVGKLEMRNGFVAYSIAYFSEVRPRPVRLTAPWPRTIYTYRTDHGDARWRVAAEHWDFDLAPWIRHGRLRWLLPESGGVRLNDSGDDCAFVGLPGRRRRIVVRGYVVTTLAAG